MGRRGEYVIVIGADGKPLRKELTKSESDLKKWQALVKRTQKEIEGSEKKNAQAMAAITSAVKSMGGVANLSAQQVELLRQKIDKLSAAGVKLPASLKGLEKLPATVRGLEKGLVTKLEGQLKAIGTDLGKDLSRNLGAAGAALSALGPAGLAASVGLGAVVAVGAGTVAFLTNLADKAIAYGGGIADAAAKNQMGVETFQALTQGLGLTGVSMEEVQQAATGMQKELVKNPQAFKDLGLSVEELRAMDPADAFLKTAQALAGIPDPAARTAAAFDLFGKSGPAVAAAVSQMGDAAERAKALGNVMSADVIGGLDATGDAAQTLGVTWEHLWLNIGAAIGTAPGVAESIDSITESLGGISRMIQDNQDVIQPLVSQLLPAVAGGVKLLANGVETLVGALERLKKAWDLQVPAWVKEIAGGSLTGKVLGLLQDASGVTPRAPTREAKNMAGPGLTLVGPGVMTPERKKAAEERKRKAAAEFKENTSAMAEAMRAAKKDTDDFWAHQESRASESAKKVLEKLLSSQKAMAGVITGSGKETQKFWEDQEKLASEKGKQVLEKLLEDQRKAFEENQRMVGGIHQLGDAIDGLAMDVGGALGGILSFGAGVIHTIGSIKDEALRAQPMLAKLAGAVGAVGSILSGPRGLKGGASGALKGAAAGAAFGSVGAIVGGIAGGILGLFGGQKKEKPPVKTLAEQFNELRTAAEKAGSVGDRALRDIIQRAQQAGQKIPEVQAFLREAVEKQVSAAAGIVGTKKDGQITGGVQLFDEKSAAAQATIFTGTFWAAVKELGLVAGVDALAAPFDALRERLTAGGFDVDKLLGGIGGIFDAIANNPNARPALEGMDALRQSLIGQADANMLNRDAVLAYGQAAQDAFRQAVEGGLSQEEAYKAVGPLLATLVQAAGNYGLELDDNTRALIDQAKAAGVAFPEEPIDRAAKAMERVATALERVLGISGQVGDSFDSMAHKAGTVQIPTSAGGVAKVPTDEELAFVTAQAGLGPKRLTSDTLILAHEGEQALIVPKGQSLGFVSATGGYGARVRAGQGGGAGEYGRASDSMERLLAAAERSMSQPGQGTPDASAPFVPVVFKVGERVLVEALAELRRDNRHSARTRLG